MTKYTDSIALFSTLETECSYLKNQQAINQVIDPEYPLDQKKYLALSQLGFRRSGNQVYRPGCSNCNRCIATRISVEQFNFGRRFKRVVKLNKDLNFNIVANINTDEHYHLYQKYINQRHSQGPMFPPTFEQYNSFLNCHWLTSQYFEWRLNNKLVCVAVTDDFANAFSAIYTFFDDSLHRRSLGTLAVLEQITQAMQQQKAFLYLGYWIENSPTMHYKIQFQPLQGFIQGEWRPINPIDSKN